MAAADHADDWGRADGDEAGVGALALPLRYQQTSPCEKHDCRHGVCLANKGGLGYRCQCDPGYEGETRDKLFKSIEIFLWFFLFIHGTTLVNRIVWRLISYKPFIAPGERYGNRMHDKTLLDED